MSNFKLVCETRASDTVPVRKYVSGRTGLTVIIAGVEGPVVNGFFCLATEAHDDDGLPHTLEHLIFLGSKRYPFKGVLDLLANRCLANGTNAWTDIDHTCYTIRTAGAEGMLTLLPIYLDHILRPTLTEHGFVTEVHHVDGAGEDAGVVYCEMQGRENMAASRCQLSLLRAMYPGSGYSSETGGIMANLRTSTDNKKVRDFHKKFYRAENLAVILTGQIEPEDVFRALQQVEDDIVAGNAAEAPAPWKRPWQAAPPPPNYAVLKVEWPADAEDCGHVVLGWTGPGLHSDGGLKRLAACAVLLRYLCDTPAAPLQKHLVEREDALAGDISYNVTENLSPLLHVTLENVPVNKLERAHLKALEVFEKLRSGEEALDMKRLQRLLRKQLVESLASLESDPHHAVAFQCIGDMLYSRDENDFVARLNSQVMLRELMSEPPEYWRTLLKTYYNEKMVAIVGSPSIALQTRMAEEEKNRIKSQQEALGAEGLAEKERIFKEAVQFNERELPAGLLASVPIPSCGSLKSYSVRTWWSGGESCPHFDVAAVPLYARVHSIKTNFIYLNLVFDLTAADRATRQWLTTVVSSWGECAVRRDGELVPYEQVVAELEEVTVKHDNQIGFGRPGHFSVGQFGNYAYIEMTCEPAEYERVVRALWEMLHAAVISRDRLLVITQRLINDVSQVRRNGNKMTYDILRDALYSEDSNLHWSSLLRQHAFLTDVLARLNAGGAGAEAVLAEAERAYRTISATAWLHMATDLERFGLSAAPWARFARENEVLPSPPKLYWDADLMSSKPGGCVVGVGGVESNFLVQLCPGLLSYSHPDIAPTMLLLNYFTQLEGPMWRLIRGCGLSYGYRALPSLHEGRLEFSLYKSTNVVEAYTKAKAIIEEYLAGGSFDEDLFESAKSSMIFELVDNEKCPADLARESLLNYLRQVQDTYNRDLACAVSAVTPAQAHEAAKRWLPNYFDTTRAHTAVVCHPSKVADTRDAFLKIGVDLKAFECIESSHFGK